MSGEVTADRGRELAIRLRYACEAHDPTIGSHLDRVTRYASEIGRLVGLPADALSDLHYATPLHDLGKIGVPLALLTKPGSLSREEMDQVKRHTLIGYQILEGSTLPIIKCAALIALSHHENWDGLGYPHGISGRNIPLEARIVAVADVYDALLSRRSYKPAWEEDRVMSEMCQMREIKFDPEILDLFIGHLPKITLAAEMVSDRTK